MSRQVIPLLILILLGFTNGASAQDPDECKDIGQSSTVFYVNGVWKTKNDAYLSLAKLQDKVDLVPRVIQAPVEQYCLAYNQKASKAKDLIEAYDQIQQDQDWILLWNTLAGLDKSQVVNAIVMSKI